MTLWHRHASLGLLSLLNCAPVTPVEVLFVRVSIPTCEQFPGVVALVFSGAIWRDFCHVVDYRVYDGRVSFCSSHFSCVPCRPDAYLVSVSCILQMNNVRSVASRNVPATLESSPFWLNQNFQRLYG